MSDSTISLIIEGNAEGAKIAIKGVTAETDSLRGSLKQAGVAGTQAGNEIASGMKVAEVNIMEARHSAMLASEAIGVHMPRAVSTMLAHIGPIGGVLQAAFYPLAALFLIKIMGDVIEKAKAWYDALGKLSEAEQKFYDAATKDAKEYLNTQSENIKASYELAIAQAEGDPAKQASLRVDMYKALGVLQNGYLDGLHKEMERLRGIRDENKALAKDKADQGPEIGGGEYTPEMLGAGVALVASKRAEQAQKDMDDLQKVIDAASNYQKKNTTDQLNAGHKLTEGFESEQAKRIELAEQAADKQITESEKVTKFQHEQGLTGIDQMMSDLRDEEEQRYAVKASALETLAKLEPTKHKEIKEELELLEIEHQGRLADIYREGAKQQDDDDKKAIAEKKKALEDADKAAEDHLKHVEQQARQELLIAQQLLSDKQKLTGANLNLAEAQLRDSEERGLMTKKEVLQASIGFINTELKDKLAAIRAETDAKVKAINDEINAEKALAAAHLAAGGSTTDKTYQDALSRVAELQTQVNQLQRQGGVDAQVAQTQTQIAIQHAQTQLDLLSHSWADYFAKMKNETQDLASTINDTLQKDITQMQVGFGNAMGQMIVEGKNWQQAMWQIEKKMLEDFISMLVQQLEKWIMVHALMPAIARASQAVGLAQHLAMSMAEKVVDAHTGAAGAAAAVAPTPIIGPSLAPLAAAETFGVVMAAQRGMIVPSGSGGPDSVLSLLSPKEMVLPEHISTAVSDMANKGGTSGPGGDAHFHFHGFDGEDVERTFMAHLPALGNAWHAASRGGHVDVQSALRGK